MSKRPLVSIITPSYNQAAFLEQTIRSVLAQDYPHIEYIIVDGGSTDGSLDIIRRYETESVRWVSEADAGQADAINKGFRLAGGDIVAWLNSDDLYYPGAVSAAVHQFEQQPSLGLLYGDCAFIDRAGNFLRYFSEIEPYNEFRLRNCSDSIMQPATFFRRDALFEIGLLDEHLHFCMDWDLWCRFARSDCSVHYERRLMAATRVYAETKTMAGSRARLAEIRHVLRRHGTGLWPHAYCGFLSTEVRRRLAEEATLSARRFLLWPWLLLLRVGNVRNILYDLFRRNDLYGIRRHSNALERTARIHFPVYQRATACRVTLRSRCRGRKGRRQTVDVRIAGERLKRIPLGGYNASCTFTVPLTEGLPQAHGVDVELEFSEANVRGIAAVLDEAVLV